MILDKNIKRDELKVSLVNSTKKNLNNVGTCLELISDQGLEFKNKLCLELCKMLQINHGNNINIVRIEFSPVAPIDVSNGH